MSSALDTKPVGLADLKAALDATIPTDYITYEEVASTTESNPSVSVTDADTLQGHPSSDFVFKTNSYISNNIIKLNGITLTVPNDAYINALIDAKLSSSISSELSELDEVIG